MKRLLFSILMLISIPYCLIGQNTLEVDKAQYPATYRSNTTDLKHKIAVQDPYRWLESSNSPEVQQWLKAQDSFSRNYVQGLPVRSKILDYMKEVSPRPVYYDAPHRRGDYWFYQKLWRDEDGQAHQVLFRQKGLKGEAETLIDADTYGEKAQFATYPGSGAASFKLSPSGRFIAFGVTVGTSRWSEWYVYDTRFKKVLDSKITGINTRAAVPTVSWAPDDSGFYYAAFEQKERANPRDQKLFFHSLRAGEEDRLVFQLKDDPDLQFYGQASADGNFLIIRTYKTVQEGLFFLNLKKKNAKPRTIYSGDEKTYTLLRNEDTTFYFFTNDGAPKGKVVKINIAKEDTFEQEEVIPEDPNATLVSVNVVGGQYLTYYTKDALPLVKTYDFKGQFQKELDLPYIGWLPAGFVGTPEDPMIAFNIQNTADPGSTYLLDTQTGKSTLFFKRSQNFDASAYETRQVFYRAKDGTRIPLFLMYKKGLQLDGNNPAWLYAYGSRWSAAPWYQIQHRVWLDMGGIYALANIRGGGEYGQEWIEAGIGLNKQTGIDDFIAAGEWLIENKYTSSQKLVCNGGSASGPLAGAALNQRPDLFGAALISYGNTDLIRYSTFSGSMGNIHGDPEEPDMFKALLSWSPYHNTRPGTCYPPTFIAHGNDDQLLASWHSYKLAAALQYAQACDQPIFLQIAWERGHTVGGLDERANQLAFLAKVLNIEIGW